MVNPVTVALVNDYDIVVAGLAAMLQPYSDRIAILDRAVERAPDRAVDVSLFDTYGVPDQQIERVRQLASDPLAGSVVVYSFGTTEGLVRAVIDAGAMGFVAKTATARQLAEAVVAVADGKRVVVTPPPHRHLAADLGWPGRSKRLSGRDSELLLLLRRGCTNRQMAEQLYLSENTVKTHLRRLFAKLGVTNRTQAAMVATDDPEFRPRS